MSARIHNLPGPASDPAHELSAECWCGPDVSDDGEVTWVIHRESPAMRNDP